MLNKIAFANALAILTAFFYLVFYLLSVVAPAAFAFLFNAQFLGADVASLLPKDFSFGKSLGLFVTLTATSWILGYVWAWLYNRFAK